MKLWKRPILRNPVLKIGRALLVFLSYFINKVPGINSNNIHLDSLVTSTFYRAHYISGQILKEKYVDIKLFQGRNFGCDEDVRARERLKEEFHKLGWGMDVWDAEMRQALQICTPSANKNFNYSNNSTLLSKYFQ